METLILFVLMVISIVNVLVIVYFIKKSKKKDGYLMIDISGEKDIYRFVCDTPIEELRKKKNMVMKILPDAKLPD